MSLIPVGFFKFLLYALNPDRHVSGPGLRSRGIGWPSESRVSHFNHLQRATSHLSSSIHTTEPAGRSINFTSIMGSDYEFDDDDGDYYDSDEDMIDGTQDGQTIS